MSDPFLLKPQDQQISVKTNLKCCGGSRGALGGSLEPPFGSLISMQNTDLNVYFCSKVPFRESTNPRSNPPSQNPGSAPEVCLILQAFHGFKKVWIFLVLHVWGISLDYTKEERVELSLKVSVEILLHNILTKLSNKRFLNLQCTKICQGTSPAGGGYHLQKRNFRSATGHQGNLVQRYNTVDWR